MEELVNLVVEKTGIPEATAEQAVGVVMDYLKDNLPASLAGQVESALEGGSGLADAAKGLGGLLGGN